MAENGATANERLLAAARSDNEDLLLEVFDEGNFDINFKDGLGNTALHNAVSHGSTDALEHILSYEGCDVDLQNKLEGATPLHLAIRAEDKELRRFLVESLLDAGADTSIKDKNGETVQDLVSPDDAEVIALLNKAKASKSILDRDIANDDDDDDEEDSGSDED